jgi:hypothetical protein
MTAARVTLYILRDIGFCSLIFGLRYSWVVSGVVRFVSATVRPFMYHGVSRLAFEVSRLIAAQIHCPNYWQRTLATKPVNFSVLFRPNSSVRSFYLFLRLNEHASRTSRARSYWKR